MYHHCETRFIKNVQAKRLNDDEDESGEGKKEEKRHANQIK